MFLASARRFSIAVSTTVFLAAAMGIMPVIAAPPANPFPGPTVTSELMNLKKTLAFRGWMTSCDRYERQEGAVVLSAGKAQVKAFTCDYTTGGTPIPFGVSTTLTLTLDGKPVATAAVNASDSAV